MLVTHSFVEAFNYLDDTSKELQTRQCLFFISEVYIIAHHFRTRVGTGSPGHRVIIVTRYETRIFSNFPIFEQMLKMHSLHFKC